MRMPSISNNRFAKVPKADIQRSSFDRSHGYKTTFDSGYLVPIYVDEALPGDTFSLNLTAFARLATPVKPIMDNMFLDSFFFAVPYRLVWDNWQKFNGEQVNPGDSTDYLVPTVTGPSGNGILSNSLADYLGIPVGIPSIVYNNLHSRAYNLVWNEFFRDENLQNSVTVDKGDGPDTYSNYTLLRRGKRHDYFTSSLPWPQKGTAVTLPLGTTAPVRGVTGRNTKIYNDQDSTLRDLVWQTDRDIVSATGYTPSGTGPLRFGTGNTDIGLETDLSSALAPTINSFREALQLQDLFERDARGGTRYTEIVHAHFGVVSPDARLQRPEYLGGGSTPININPVTQTTPTPDAGPSQTPQGNLAAFGTTHASGHGFTKSFTEHCLLIGLVSVRADLTYQQGLDRMFSRQTRFDFYWPALAHLGEQPVYNKEIYMQGDANDDLVFGYQERHAEYRYKPSKITGLFRSNVSSGETSIDIWHLSQDFGTLPVLGDTFIQDTPPVSRVVVTQSEPQFIYDSFIKLHCARPMPVYGVPASFSRF